MIILLNVNTLNTQLKADCEVLNETALLEDLLI